MILVIDTSSSTAALATIDADTGAWAETFVPSRDPALMAQLRGMARDNAITSVAVATGPGSFTGLRKGVAFGLGLAMGLRIPIVPLPTLELQAARSDEPVTAVSEAGRGRFYHLVPGEPAALGEPDQIATSHRLVGSVSPRGKASLQEAGHTFKPESELRHFAEAASLLMKSAREAPYSSLKLEYMQSFAARAK